MSKKESRTLLSYESEEDLSLAKHVADALYRFDSIAEDRLPDLAAWGDDVVRRFWEQGYLVVENALSEDEVREASEAIDDILSGASQGSKIQFVKPRSELHTMDDVIKAARKIYEYADHEPRLRSIVLHAKLLAALERLFGEAPKPVQDQALLKPPSGGAEKPWHQDMAYGPLAYDKSVVGVWIALDPAELDNGCMHVIPYSHREGGAPHYAVRDWQLCDASVRVDRDVAVPLAPGGALFFSGLLHHGTPPNFSSKRRRALQIHYAPESARKLSPQEYKRMFTNEMTGAEC
ncbi:phytanoyl-CoA dioxygenase family protein [Paenibacillus antri]|uniref:Phytanoyl-CoA dioxygenase family protein n=1 Tax=Paenibacillus antri TaxID=2582848 RepID=A0A5R9FYS2_9BACL|nr:phytanoyl-CoA dioxygenase family protein [Paenibacillus antri]TLS49192.1 phytanoyl-CoA dioxygenase family protein [Paenibacillus antri]